MNKKYKIAIFNGYYPEIIGGAEFQAKEIAILLKDSNCEVFFLSIGHSQDGISEIDGFKVYKFKNPGSLFNQSTAYFFFSLRILKILKNEKTDLIYERMLNSFSPYLAYFAFKKNIPFVLHIANKHSLIFNNSLRSYFRKFLFNITKKYIPFFVVQNNEQYDLLNHHGIEASIILPNLVKLQFKNYEISNAPFKIYWIGNNRPVKQLDKFLIVADSFKENHNLHFYIIGKIDDFELIKKLRETKNIDYLGVLSNEQVNAYLVEAFLLINTSKSEGFSNTFIQSWMHGTPVISLNSDPNNFIQNYKAGVVCKGADIMLNQAVDSFFSDNDLYHQTVNACRELCENELNYNINSSKFIDFLMKLLDEK